MSKQLIKLGHSPDPDDAFMFYGLACGAVDSGDFEFEHVMRDIQTLNDWAGDSKLEVTAISVHAYPYVQDKYLILSSGASMGATRLVEYEADPGKNICYPPTADESTSNDACGPLLVTAEPLGLDDLADKIIAVPGTLTSAFLALRLAIGQFDYLVMMFDEIMDAVKQGKVSAGLIIHEGQLTYKDSGLHCVMDMGRWWHDKTSLPLPLGCNVIRRDLGQEVMAQISSILKASIAYGLENRKEAVEYALQFGRGLDSKLADKFVGMYVNEWTLDYGPVGGAAIAELLNQGHQAEMIPQVKKLRFV